MHVDLWLHLHWRLCVLDNSCRALQSQVTHAECWRTVQCSKSKLIGAVYYALPLSSYNATLAWVLSPGSVDVPLVTHMTTASTQKSLSPQKECHVVSPLLRKEKKYLK
eukprot:2591393-Amphidinium_carterae.1